MDFHQEYLSDIMEYMYLICIEMLQDLLANYN